MVKKLLNLKIRYCIFTLFFLGAISIFANTAATANSSFSLLNNKAVVAVGNNASNIYGENITLSNNLFFANYLWIDTPTAQAGFKMVFQKLAVVLLKGEVLFDLLCPSVSIAASPTTSICEGTSVTFTTTLAVEGISQTYQWQINSVDVPGQNASTFIASTLTNNQKVSVIMTSRVARCLPTSPLEFYNC